MRNRYINQFLATAVILIVVDITMIYLVMKPLFEKQIRLIQGSVMALDPLAAVLSYIILVSGVYFFLVYPRRTLLEAFALGFFVYSTYELTSKSILRSWKWQTVVIDSVWGGSLFAITTFLALRSFGTPVRFLPVGWA